MLIVYSLGPISSLFQNGRFINMWDKYLLDHLLLIHGICKSWRNLQHSHWSNNSILLLLHLKYLKIILFETIVPLWSWFSTKSPFTTNLVHKQTVIKLSTLACYSGNRGNWQPNRYPDVGISIISLCIHTYAQTHTYACVCVCVCVGKSKYMYMSIFPK